MLHFYYGTRDRVETVTSLVQYHYPLYKHAIILRIAIT